MNPKPKRRMRKLEVDRVDLVDRGANHDLASGDGSHILLMKRELPPAEEQQAEAKGLLAKLAALMGIGEAPAVAKQDLSCPNCGYGLVSGYGPNGYTIPNYCPECGAKLTLRSTTTEKKAEETIMTEADIQKRIDEALAAALKKQADETAAAVAKAVKDAEDRVKAAAELEKAELQKRLDAAEAEQKRVAELAKAETERREIAEHVALAKSYSNLPVKAAEDGQLFYRLSKTLDAADVTRLHEILKAADEQVRVSKLFGSIGYDHSGAVPDSAEAELMAKAEEIRKADPKLSMPEAVDLALTQNRDLANRYSLEKSNQAARKH